tara:strand:+ start:54 stop:407 length:354 start_codon:yes stop_codon:yes gene_type:complete
MGFKMKGWSGFQKKEPESPIRFDFNKKNDYSGKDKRSLKEKNADYWANQKKKREDLYKSGKLKKGSVADKVVRTIVPENNIELIGEIGLLGATKIPGIIGRGFKAIKNLKNPTKAAS